MNVAVGSILMKDGRGRVEFSKSEPVTGVHVDSAIRYVQEEAAYGSIDLGAAQFLIWVLEELKPAQSINGDG